MQTHLPSPFRARLHRPVLFFLAVIMLSLSWGAALAADPPSTVLQAAAVGLPRFLALVPGGGEAAYGFSGPAELAGAALGRAYRLNVITPQVLEQSGSDAKVEALLAPSNLWFFEVTAGGRTAALLAVDCAGDGGCRAVSLGRAGLAARMAAARDGAGLEAAGEESTLAVMFQAREYFLALPRTRSRAMISLDSPQGVRGARVEGAFEGLPAIVARLKTETRENLENGGAR